MITATFELIPEGEAVYCKNYYMDKHIKQLTSVRGDLSAEYADMHRKISGATYWKLVSQQESKICRSILKS